MDQFWTAVTNEQALAALKFTLIASLIVAAINALIGTLIAWVLVRDEFRGKNRQLADRPAVRAADDRRGPHAAGAVRAAQPGRHRHRLHQGRGDPALLFVTLPFVVRTVQPVLIELDREMEEAAASLGAGDFTIFRRIVLPNLIPAILAGVALAFARASASSARSC